MDLTDKGLFLIYIKKSGQIVSALPNIITVKERRVFDSHENNINLRNHTNCVFAVRMSSFIPLPKVLLEYTHLDVTLLLECHHQNAKCSTFC